MKFYYTICTLYVVFAEGLDDQSTKVAFGPRARPCTVWKIRFNPSVIRRTFLYCYCYYCIAAAARSRSISSIQRRPLSLTRSFSGTGPVFIYDSPRPALAECPSVIIGLKICLGLPKILYSFVSLSLWLAAVYQHRPCSISAHYRHSDRRTSAHRPIIIYRIAVARHVGPGGLTKLSGPFSSIIIIIIIVIMNV